MARSAREKADGPAPARYTARGMAQAAGTGRALAAAHALALALMGCGSPPPPAPSAVIDTNPGSVCQGDDHETPVHLDATASAPRLTLVPVAPREGEAITSIRWTFTGSEYRIVEGSEQSLELKVTLQADRPLHVRLTLENDAGGEAEARTTISVTERLPDGSCPERVEP
jgi:hypothetical protein